MKLMTAEEIEALACKHHDYGCGRAPGEPVIAEHCFDAAGLVGFVRAIETSILQRSVLPAKEKAATGRAVIVDLLGQIDSLQSYELTRDLEGYKAQAIWDSAIENAKRYCKPTGEPPC